MASSGDRLRVALFAAGGEIPLAALRCLHEVSEVVVVVRPGRHAGIGPAIRGVARRLLSRRTPADPLSALSTRLGISEIHACGAEDPAIAPRLRRDGIDLACVATFPWRLRPAVIGVPPLGMINVHPSLLPRHRGPNPWLWTYHADDREVGVTVHLCEETIDTGAILGQRSWPLPRGYPMAALHGDVAERGAALLVETIRQMSDGNRQLTAQDPSRATKAPRVKVGTRMVDPAWPAERAWHFLAGTAGQFREPLLCRGAPVPYTRVGRFDCVTLRRVPGTVEAAGGRGGWRLWCRDGFVQLEAEQP